VPNRWNFGLGAISKLRRAPRAGLSDRRHHRGGNDPFAAGRAESAEVSLGCDVLIEHLVSKALAELVRNRNGAP
jgi:hypothetical protein